MKNEQDISDENKQAFDLWEFISPDGGSDLTIKSAPAQSFFPAFFDFLKGKRLKEKQEGKSSAFNTNIIKIFSQKISLHFAGTENDLADESTSPVCFADSGEVRDEFKIEILPQSFTGKDILDYACSILSNKLQDAGDTIESMPGTFLIPYPKNQIIFWQEAEKGRAIRKQYEVW